MHKLHYSLKIYSWQLHVKHTNYESNFSPLRAQFVRINNNPLWLNVCSTVCSRTNSKTETQGPKIQTKTKTRGSQDRDYPRLALNFDSKQTPELLALDCSTRTDTSHLAFQHFTRIKSSNDFIACIQLVVSIFRLETKRLILNTVI